MFQILVTSFPNNTEKMLQKCKECNMLLCLYDFLPDEMKTENLREFETDKFTFFHKDTPLYMIKEDH